MDAATYYEVFKTIREQLLDLRIRQPVVFGNHGFRLHPVVSEAKILAFEREHNLHLPEEYRDFIQRVCSGGAGPSYGLEMFESLKEPCVLMENSTPSSLFSRDESESPDFEEEYEKRYRVEYLKQSQVGKISRGLQISDRGCGMYYALAIDGPYFGEIWDVGEYGQVRVLDKNGRPETFLSWYQTWLSDCVRKSCPPQPFEDLFWDLKAITWLVVDMRRSKEELADCEKDAFVYPFAGWYMNEVSEEKIISFETKYCVALPEEYRTFIAFPHPEEVNDKTFLSIVKESNFIGYKTTVPYQDWIGDQSISFPSHTSFSQGSRVVSGALPIAASSEKLVDEGYILVTQGEQRGQIWWFGPSCDGYDFRPEMDAAGRPVHFYQWVRDGTTSHILRTADQVYGKIFYRPRPSTAEMLFFRVHSDTVTRTHFLIAIFSGGADIIKSLNDLSAKCEPLSDIYKGVADKVLQATFCQERLKVNDGLKGYVYHSESDLRLLFPSPDGSLLILHAMNRAQRIFVHS